MCNGLHIFLVRSSEAEANVDTLYQICHNGDMVESFKEKRVLFPQGGQRAFIDKVEEKISIRRMAGLCSCSERTIRDWRREKFPLRRSCLLILCKHSGLPVPKKLEYRGVYDHVRRAGKMGGQAVMRKYGRVPSDEQYRKQRWADWWQKEGVFREYPILRAKPIRRPKASPLLAEFIGIVMGDGGITQRQVTITLHHTDDRAYAAFVTRLIKRLFGVTPRIYHAPKDSVLDIVVSRTELVRYLHALGLPIGNKVRQRIDIPGWIIKDPALSLACIRGLIDTDGCVFTHRYRVRGKLYTYKKISFTSRSKPLLNSVGRILSLLGIVVRTTQYDVFIDSVSDVKKYFMQVRPHNQKHLNRYRN